MTTITCLLTAAHLAALSQIETGDCDTKIGRNGEVTRYQIAPAVLLDELRPVDKVFTLPRPELDHLVLSLWQRRVNYFIKEHVSKPTPVQIYLLWHRPARVFNTTARERERAERFANVLATLQKIQDHQ